jgi:flagellar biosynthesis chaperone FliJ
MSYEVQIRHSADSGDGISIEAKVEGVPVAHTFPKGMGYFEKPEGENRPRFVEKLEEKYEEKMKRQGKASIQEMTTEEAKIHSSHFVNKTYEGDETFKDEENESGNMPDLDQPEEIRRYLKENMAEGYLSKEEGLNIDRFVDRYKQNIEEDSKAQDIIREAYEAKVQ